MRDQNEAVLGAAGLRRCERSQISGPLLRLSRGSTMRIICGTTSLRRCERSQSLLLLRPKAKPMPLSRSAAPHRWPRLEGLAYGGDYNPEQWPEEVWAEDVA